VHARFHPPRALALATLGAGAPAAQAAWTPPQVLVRDRGAANVSAAGNGRGSEAFVWKVTSGRVIRAGDRTGAASYVRARIRRPDGRLGRARTISRTGAIVADPQIGVDERGNATAVWAQAGRHLTIMAAVRPHGRRFGRPFELGALETFRRRPARARRRTLRRHGRRLELRAQHRRRAPRAVDLRAAPQPGVLRRAAAVGPLGSAYVVRAAQTRTAGAVHTRLHMTAIRRDGRALGRSGASTPYRAPRTATPASRRSPCGATARRSSPGAPRCPPAASRTARRRS
jgi:hypothetical protein